jgi:hypothetical protein
MERRGLYEYLSHSVEGPVRHALPSSERGDSTLLTKADGETYDDDSGLSSIGIPITSELTIHTRQDSETYDDDPGLSPLGLPIFFESTKATFVSAETFDDDADLFGLSLPTLQSSGT